MPACKVVPAILSADKKEFKAQITKLQNRDLIQLDICDGQFVSNKTLQPDDFKGTKFFSQIEYHLMVKDINHYIEHFVRKNAKTIIFHFEACKNDSEVIKIIRHIHDHNVRAAIAINPETSISSIKKFLKLVEQVVVMTVHPGTQGQTFIAKMLNKVKTLRKLAPNLDIEVDGGVNKETILLAKKAGANLFVVGSAIINTKNPEAEFKKIQALVKNNKTFKQH